LVPEAFPVEEETDGEEDADRLVPPVIGGRERESFTLSGF
jgi:hypothetical protein